MHVKAMGALGQVGTRFMQLTNPEIDMSRNLASPRMLGNKNMSTIQNHFRTVQQEDDMSVKMGF